MEEDKTRVILKIWHFDKIDSAVIISSVSVALPCCTVGDDS